MNKMLVVMLGSIVALGAMIWMLPSGSQRKKSPEATEPLMFFCAASNRAVMEKIVSEYKKNVFNTPVGS